MLHDTPIELCCNEHMKEGLSELSFPLVWTHIYINSGSYGSPTIQLFVNPGLLYSNLAVKNTQTGRVLS